MPLVPEGPSRAPGGRVGFPAMNTAVKWVGGAVAVPVLALVLYLGAVLQVYILAAIVDLIGIIFT